MSTTLSCGECGAALRPGQGWCSLCFVAVQASFDPLTAPLDEVVERSDAPEAPSAQPPPVDGHEGSELLVPVSPISATPTDDVGETAEPGQPLSNMDVMLSMLAAEERRNDPTAGLAERLDDRASRMAVIFAIMLLIGGVGLLLLTVLGVLF